jgi:hypothetical protein
MTTDAPIRAGAPEDGKNASRYPYVDGTMTMEALLANMPLDVMAMRQQRADDAVKAWSQHLAEQKATAAKTARLRQQRLAREAELTSKAVRKS